jgi:hypothetical protein
MNDINVEKVEPADEAILEEWRRATAEPDLLGVGAVRISDGEWQWQVLVSVMELVREEPLESELVAAVSAALAAVPGVREAAQDDRETWVIKGAADGASLVRAAAAVVDRFSPRTRAILDELDPGQ